MDAWPISLSKHIGLSDIQSWLVVLFFYSSASCRLFACCALTLSPPIPLRLYTLSYWSNPPFLISDIRALWRSALSTRVPKCQKLKMWVRPGWHRTILNVTTWCHYTLKSYSVLCMYNVSLMLLPRRLPCFDSNQQLSRKNESQRKTSNRILRTNSYIFIERRCQEPYVLSVLAHSHLPVRGLSPCKEKGSCAERIKSLHVC